MSKQGKSGDLAHAVMAAIEPIVAMLLEWGVTSPEAESLLRGLFVHKAQSWLASQDAGRRPSDVSVALVTGVHRNFVRSILRNRPRISPLKERKGSKLKRLLEAWRVDPVYLDVSGSPRELPKRGRAPSFESLTATYLRGASYGVALGESVRAGLVELVPGNRVRIRRRSAELVDWGRGGAREYGVRGREFLETLSSNLRRDRVQPFFDVTPEIGVDVERAAAIKAVIAQKAALFLEGVRQELDGEKTVNPRRRNVRLSVGVYQVEKMSGE